MERKKADKIPKRQMGIRGWEFDRRFPIAELAFHLGACNASHVQLTRAYRQNFTQKTAEYD